MRPLLAWALVLMAGCAATEDSGGFETVRSAMVEHQIRSRGIRDTLVLKAMAKVPRHLFVPPEQRTLAYADHPLPIGWGQTISQPYIVALMTEALGLKGGERVLEIGTGSGYQAAVLAEIAREVYTIEILEPLAQRADSTLRSLGYDNVSVKCGDGFWGWPEASPFQAIIVTCAPEELPQPLWGQLDRGGRLVAPLGEEGSIQRLMVFEKTEQGIVSKAIADVIFVPMAGDSAKRKAGQK